jgi:putative transposase
VIERPASAYAIEPRQPTLGSDNGTAYTSGSFRVRLAELEITHRRGGYRDPESQAFIESFSSKLKERAVWRNEFETLDDAREVIGDYIDDRYANRPHSRLGYRTPLEVRQT